MRRPRKKHSKVKAAVVVAAEAAAAVARHGGRAAAKAAEAVEVAAAAWVGAHGREAEARPAFSRSSRKASRVKAGDIVAKLDGAALRRGEEQVQKIRYLQAKSYVEHAVKHNARSKP